MLSNYPDGMDWGAFDDYTDPVVECCERRASSCECNECANCGRFFNDDHEWEEVPNSDDIVCASCYEELEEDE